MMVYSLGFLMVALLAMVLGWQGFAWAAAVVAIAFFVLTFFAGGAIPLWQYLVHRGTVPPV